MHLTRLWKNIESRLDSELKGWRGRIIDLRQVQAVEDRRRGEEWTDDEVFVALLEARLSAGVDWSGIKEKVLPVLDDFLRSELRTGSFLESYSNLTDARIQNRWKNWFKERRATPRWGMRPFLEMKRAARKLAAHSAKYGRAEDYFTRLIAQNDNDPKQVALCVGSDVKYKLPSLGIALAAEALKNLGFDVAKPDTHVRRAVAAFGLADFKPSGTRYESPLETVRRQLQTMKIVEDIAHASSECVAFVDNAIWMLGAQRPFGLHLENLQLAELAVNKHMQRMDQSGLLALLDSWMKEGDAEEQKETIEYLIRALDENRPEGYKLFPPELKGKSW